MKSVGSSEEQARSAEDRAIFRLIASTLAAACWIVLAFALLNWVLTESFYLQHSFQGSLLVSLLAIVSCAIGSAALLGIFSMARRIRPVGGWLAAVSGGLLYWLVPYVLTGEPLAGLLICPAGVLAGLLIQGSPSGTRLMSWTTGIALAFALLSWLALLALPFSQTGDEGELVQPPPANSLLGTDLLGGAALGSEIWLFNGNGKAVSFRLSDWRPTLRASSNVAALKTGGAAMWVLLAPSVEWAADHQPASRFRLASYADGRWSYGPWEDYAVDERPLALAVDTERVILLGPKRIYILDKAMNSVTTQPLRETVGGRGQFVTALVGGDAMYVGINRGEWGGGLLRVNLETGDVVPVERHDDDSLCSGPLNRECDPVTGLVPDGNRPGCVFASIGLSHWSWHGRVLRVCGDRVETVFEARMLPIVQRIRRALAGHSRDGPLSTEPVFSLLPSPGGFLAVTPRAVYRWDRGVVHRQRVPNLEQARGLATSKAIPGLVLVTTDANAAYSLSGTTPLAFATSH